jgi:endonuclease/exonuclease/phosphatase family metal-dependent hydrolase
MTKFGHTTARIAAWNLSGFNKIPKTRLVRQAEGLAWLDAEVIALVEVNPLTALTKLKSELGKKGVVYESIYKKQKNKLNLAVLYKKGVKAKNARFIPGSDLGESSKRQALVVDMTVGGYTFVLIVVHLKAGRRKKEQGIRDKQAKVIGAYIEARKKAKPSEDILLMGDFNMIPGQDVSNFHYLGGSDTMDFVSSWDLQDRFSHILEQGRANLLDGFAIQRTHSKEYIRGSLRLFPMHWTMDMGREKYRRLVSDHLPFVGSFRID